MNTKVTGAKAGVLGGVRMSKSRAEILVGLSLNTQYHLRSDRTSFGIRRLNAANALRAEGVVIFVRIPEQGDCNYVLELSSAGRAALAAFSEGE